jgi:aldehyde dehydrogenase (NAD+)
LSYIDSGKQQGAKLHVGGEQHGSNGFFIQPTIFTDVQPDMKIAQEEVFGPVAIVVKFKTDQGHLLVSLDQSRWLINCHRGD